jgi:hypothetical protein
MFEMPEGIHQNPFTMQGIADGPDDGFDVKSNHSSVKSSSDLDPSVYETEGVGREERFTKWENRKFRNSYGHDCRFEDCQIELGELLPVWGLLFVREGQTVSRRRGEHLPLKINENHIFVVEDEPMYSLKHLLQHKISVTEGYGVILAPSLSCDCNIYKGSAGCPPVIIDPLQGILTRTSKICPYQGCNTHTQIKIFKMRKYILTGNWKKIIPKYESLHFPKIISKRRHCLLRCPLTVESIENVTGTKLKPTI